MSLQHCSSYDSQVSEWLWSKNGSGPAPLMTIPLVLDASLRYGENPHQAAAFYKDLSIRETSLGGVGTSVVHHGKEMSYNNYLVRNTNLGLDTGPLLAGDLDACIVLEA